MTDLVVVALSVRQPNAGPGHVTTRHDRPEGHPAMTTEPDQPPTDYPSNWKPREARERDRALDVTEAELWLGSLSPSELQAALQRGRRGQR